jgi:hypothetical protein
MLKVQGNKEAADALLKARQSDLGRKVGRLVHEARVLHAKQHEQGSE